MESSVSNCWQTVTGTIPLDRRKLGLEVGAARSGDRELVVTPTRHLLTLSCCYWIPVRGMSALEVGRPSPEGLGLIKHR